MTRHRPLATSLTSLGALALGAAALGAALPTPASACGGFFCSNQPIDQSGENIVFSVEEDGAIEAHVQILYQGAAEQFAWILPTPSAPSISVGTDALFRDLDQATRPVFVTESEISSPAAYARAAARSRVIVAPPWLQIDSPVKQTRFPARLSAAIASVVEACAGLCA